MIFKKIEILFKNIILLLIILTMFKTFTYSISRKFSKYNKANALMKIPENTIKTITLPILDKNEGLRDYLTKIYKKTGEGFLTTLTIGSMTTLLYTASPVLGIGSTLASIPFSFYSIYKIGKLETKTIIQDDKIKEIENEEKNKWYNYFSISNGILISPAILYSLTISPVVLPITLVCTGGVFGASTYYALNKKDLSLIKYHGPLVGCLGGLIATGFGNLALMFLGYHQLANTISLGTAVVGTAVFSGLIAVETQMAIKSFGEQKLDSTGTALALLLDVTNLFLDLLKIIGEITKSINGDNN